MTNEEIKEERKEEKRRWISFDEKYPEVKTDVLLCSDDESFWFGYMEESGSVVCYFGHGIDPDRRFTHWQPLPDRPHEEKKEKSGGYEDFCCRNFYEAACPGTDNEGYGSAIHGDVNKIGGYSIRMNYCPWCGEKL